MEPKYSVGREEQVVRCGQMVVLLVVVVFVLCGRARGEWGIGACCWS